MKTIKIFLITLLFLIGTLGFAQTADKPAAVWNDVITGYSRPASVIRIKEVKMYNDRTELSVQVNYTPGYWIRVQNDLYLQSGANKYKVKDATVLTLGEQFWMPESGTVDFVLTFEPLPADCSSFDFIEPDGWIIKNVRQSSQLQAGIYDTYWRNESTGDWLIGFTPDCIIYDGKFWDILSQTDSKDRYNILAINNGISLNIEVGKLRKGLRTIQIDGAQIITCSPITTEALPDYPHKDMRKGIKDNGYREGDFVTFTGWLKDMPEELYEKSTEFDISYVNILTDEDEKVYAPMDSLGRFTITMPLVNSTEVFLDWGRTTISTLLEPGERYLFLYDFSTDQKMFMGSDVRLQNELIAHPYSWESLDLQDYERGKVDPMLIWKDADALRTRLMAELDGVVKEHPDLSQRYIDYVEGSYRSTQGRDMMQARFYVSEYGLPESYMEYVGKEFWEKRSRPYGAYRDFNTFIRDYLDQLSIGKSLNMTVTDLLLNSEAVLSDEEKQIVERYENELNALKEKNGELPEAELEKLVNEFNQSEFVDSCNIVLERHADAYEDQYRLISLLNSMAIIDSLGCDKALRDIHISRGLCRIIDLTRRPLGSKMTALIEDEISLPAAKKLVLNKNEKYLSITRRSLSRPDNLKSNDVVRDMSEGEKILRKLIEPYKGKVILVDFWGTWCGPCRAALSHSHDIHEYMKPYDMIFLYLANRSPEETWKNIIKEYNVTGDNVVHYNLPEAQQKAIENFLKVDAFPTYILIDKEGNILDVNANPTHTDAFAKLVKSISE